MDDMSAARSFVLPLVVAALVFCASSSASQGAQLVRLAPTQDVSLPFWCEWGYDWEERCYRDDGDRLPVGGDEDKVWRAALRFATSRIPTGAKVVNATLRVFHDGRCLAPLKTQRTCAPRGYELEADPILSPNWFAERELDVGGAMAVAELHDASQPQWLAFDLTALVAEWVAGGQRNSGVLLRLDGKRRELRRQRTEHPVLELRATQPTAETGGELRAFGLSSRSRLTDPCARASSGRGATSDAL